MLARERRKLQRRRSVDSHPNAFLQLGRGLKRAIDHADVKQVRVEAMAGLVGGRRCESAEQADLFPPGSNAQLLGEFSRQGRERRLASFDLAAGLHEDGGAPLADEEYTPFAVIDQRSRDTDSFRHSGSSAGRVNLRKGWTAAVATPAQPAHVLGVARLWAGYGWKADKKSETPQVKAALPYVHGCRHRARRYCIGDAA